MTVYFFLLFTYHSSDLSSTILGTSSSLPKNGILDMKDRVLVVLPDCAPRDTGCKRLRDVKPQRHVFVSSVRK